MSNIHQQIAAHLQSTKSLRVSQCWLNHFVSSSNALTRNVPLSALTQTAVFRILASDFRKSLTTESQSSLLPVDIFDPYVKERRISGPVAVQVLDIEDIGTSLWSQVEAIERIERGEAIRGREIVRTVNVGEDDERASINSNNNNTEMTNSGSNAISGNSNGPHRLILQDAAGTRAVAIELNRVKEIGLGILPIGAKLLLRNVTVARGVILMVPESVTVLGGKIEALDKVWREGRKGRLLARIEGDQAQQTNGNAMDE